jgi:hypothetical protein
VSGEYFTIRKAPGVVGGAQLQPVEAATTVRVEDGLSTAPSVVSCRIFSRISSSPASLSSSSS